MKSKNRVQGNPSATKPRQASTPGHKISSIRNQMKSKNRVQDGPKAQPIAHQPRMEAVQKRGQSLAYNKFITYVTKAAPKITVVVVVVVVLGYPDGKCRLYYTTRPLESKRKAVQEKKSSQQTVERKRAARNGVRVP
jgi:hypothetical protein